MMKQMLYRGRRAQEPRKTLLQAVLAAVAVLMLVAASGGLRGKKSRYVVVFDCGSTGSRVHLYTWEPAASPTELPRLTAVPPSAVTYPPKGKPLGHSVYEPRIETQPGIQAFEEDYRALHDVGLGPLLNWARAVIPEEQRPETPVFLLATGGVRRLPQARRAELLTAAGHVLSVSGFWSRYEWVRAMSGGDEAVYGWVALNYVRGNLAGAPAARRARWRRGQRARTVGTLDLGGATLEVAFEEAADAGGARGRNISSGYTSNGEGGDVASVALAGVEYRVRSAAFAGAGLNAAFDRGVTLLLAQDAPKAKKPAGRALAAAPARQRQAPLAAVAAERHGAAALLARIVPQPLTAAHAGAAPASTPPTVRHPCVHYGYDAPYNRSELAADGPPNPPVVRLVGAYDWDACADLARRLVNASTGCAGDAQGACLQGTARPHLAGPFTAMSGFYVVAHFMRMHPGAQPGALLPASQELCAMPWNRMLAEWRGTANLERYCGWGPFVAELLRTGLGFVGDSNACVEFGGGDLGWPLGAALVEASRVPGFGPERRSVLGGPLILCLLAAACAASAAAIRWQLQLKPGRPLLRLNRAISAGALPPYARAQPPRVGVLAP